MCIMIDYSKKALVHSKTGKEVHPSCFDDLVLYHAYLISSKYEVEAQKQLKAVFKGELVITNLHNNIQKFIPKN